MAKYYFYNNAGRQGPVGAAVIKDLAARGGIQTTTTIENADTGLRSKAGQVAGLTFNQPAPNARYYYDQDNAMLGPYTLDEIKQLNTDQIISDDTICHKYDKNSEILIPSTVKIWIAQNDTEIPEPKPLSKEDKVKIANCFGIGCSIIGLIIGAIALAAHFLK